jgi:hypothetical protein
MDENKQREFLKEKLGEDVYDDLDWWCIWPDKRTAQLHGNFTAAELRALADLLDRN